MRLPSWWTDGLAHAARSSDSEIDQSPPGDAETGRLAVQRLDCPSGEIDVTSLAN